MNCSQPLVTECFVMSSRHRGNWSVYSSQANNDVVAQRFREAEALLPQAEAIPAVDPLTLPVMQQAALLQMHESYFRRNVVARLLEDSQDRPDAPDYAAPCDLGLAERQHGYRFRSLTGAGLIAAKQLEQKLCRQFDIHAFVGPLGDGYMVKFYCPCGWHKDVRNSHTAPGNARASFSRHHATAAGMSKLFAGLKPPTMIAEG